MCVSTAEIAKVKMHREEMIDSYIESIREVGGCPHIFLARIEEMTVAEMIDILAQNRIRFTVKNRT